MMLNTTIRAGDRHTVSPMGQGGRAGMDVPILLQYWRVVIRWKWVILGIIGASLLAGILLTMLATPKYTATARVEISREQQKVTNVQGLESEEFGQDLEFYQTQYSLLKARSLAERVAKDLKLATNEQFFSAHGVSNDDEGIFAGRRARPLSASERAERQDKAIGILLKNISIAPVRGSRLVDVSYTSANSGHAALIANTWTKQYIQASMDRRFASTADARTFLEGRLSDLRAKLEQSERDLVNYAASKQIVTLSTSEGADGKTRTDRTIVADDLAALNEALSRATADRVAAESKARSGAGAGATSTALANNAIGNLRQKRAELSAEYARLMVQFEPDYPLAKAVAQQVGALDASIAREEGRVGSSINAEFTEARQREDGLRARVEVLKQRLGAQQRDSIQYNIYQREADTNRELYDGLLQRYKEIGVAGVGANNISIVDAAKTPDLPSSPKLLINMILALLVGIVLAGGATFALDQIDEGVRDAGQVDRQLGIPLLGAVPDLVDKNALDQLWDAKSALSEAYLTVRSNMAFSTDHGVPKTFMVTSTREAEGKSTTSLSLATMLARTGKRTLLLDADMRSPSIHGFLNGSNERGLSNLLAGSEDWQAFIQPTQIKGLDIMAAGPMPPSAAELLSSDKLIELVAKLAEQFDHVVIDSPPMLGLADAPLLSRAVEGTVFVIEAEGVALRSVNAALDRLRSVHAHIYGAVLTKLKDRMTGYGYGYGYGYGSDRTETSR